MEIREVEKQLCETKDALLLVSRSFALQTKEQLAFGFNPILPELLNPRWTGGGGRILPPPNSLVFYLEA